MKKATKKNLLKLDVDENNDNIDLLLVKNIKTHREEYVKDILLKPIAFA